MDRNLALEFVRVTEEAAIACAKWYGKGDAKAADGAAVKAMRERFSNVDFDGTVVIGEGEIDEAPMLYTGEKVGTGKGPEIDLAIDPLEVTTGVAKGGLNSIAVIAAAPKGGLLSLPDMYMDKIAVGPDAVGKIDIDASVSDNIRAVAKALRKEVSEVTVVILDRPRHDKIVEEVRKVGARIRFIPDGDVSGAIATCLPDSGIDILFGVGKSTEGVLAAAALKCYGGEIQARLQPRNDKEKQRVIDMGLKQVDMKLSTNDLVPSDKCMFIATGVNDGPMLRGIQFRSHTPEQHNIITHSVVMRAKSKTIRYIEAHHM